MGDITVFLGSRVTWMCQEQRGEKKEEGVEEEFWRDHKINVESLFRKINRECTQFFFGGGGRLQGKRKALTQIQALNAVVFLCRDVLNKGPLGW